MVDFAKAILPSDAEIQAVLTAAASGPKAAIALITDIPPDRRPFVFRALAWLVKLGVFKTGQPL